MPAPVPRPAPATSAGPERPAAPRFRRPDRLRRALAVVALAWGLVYLVWRGMDTGHGAQPVMFWVLYLCEVFGLVMLASFAFLAWRIPVPARPALGWRPTADVFVCTYDEGLDVLERNPRRVRPDQLPPHHLGSRRRPP